MQPSLPDVQYTAMHEGDQPIAGFRLVRRRGRGGFGQVWEAEAPGGIRVALKFVHLSPRARAAELRALDFVRGIHHPNLLANFGAWQVDETLIIGMELADRSLWDRYTEATRSGLRGIPRGELLGYMVGVAAGIDHLNDYRHTVDGRGGFGVQHRDLKPSNLLLFGGGAKVADLGMARAMEGDVAGHTGIWTFAYAPPEFFRGETARQSDQYSLAVTYSQLRGGRLPFDGGAASVTAGHLFGVPDLEALPEPERAVVGRALAKIPGERWPDCRSFVDALRALDSEDVLDVLVEEGEACVLGLSAPSGLSGFSCLDSDFDSPEEWTSSSGWALTADASGAALSGNPLMESGSEFGFEAEISEDRNASTPTLVLPITPTEPDQDPVSEAPASVLDHPAPAVPRRRRRVGRLAAAATAVAVSLASARVQAPSGMSTPRPPSPALVLADGMGSAAETTSDVVPMLADESATPLPTPTPEILPAPAPTLVLEGPIAMGKVEPGALAPLPGAEPELVPEPVVAAKVPTPSEPISLVLASVAGPVASEVRKPAEGNPADAAFARGQSLFRQGSYAQAITAFDEAVQLDPNHTASVFSRAVARHRAGDPRAALADYDAVLRVRPNSVPAHTWRGQAHDALGAFDQAILDFGEVIQARPGDADARFRRGLARYKSGDFARSVGDFSETLRLDPRNTNAFRLRDDALARLNAADALQKAREATPKPAPAPTPAPIRPDARVASSGAASPATAPPGVVRETSLKATTVAPQRPRTPVLRPLLRPFARPK